VKSVQFAGIDNGGALSNGRIQLRSLLHTRRRVFKTSAVEASRALETGSCSGSANPARRIRAAVPQTSFGKQIGQVIKAVTIGP
jgi:hypothetical protein